MKIFPSIPDFLECCWYFYSLILINVQIYNNVVNILGLLPGNFFWLRQCCSIPPQEAFIADKSCHPHVSEYRCGNEFTSTSQCHLHDVELIFSFFNYLVILFVWIICWESVVKLVVLVWHFHVPRYPFAYIFMSLNSLSRLPTGDDKKTVFQYSSRKTAKWRHSERWSTC